MTKCPGCGSSLPPAARFCPLCGKNVPAAPTTGAPAVTDPAAARAASQPPGPSGGSADRRKTALAAGIAAAVIGVGLVLFLMVRAGIFSAKDTSTGASVMVAPAVEPPKAPVMTAPPTEAPAAPVLSPPTAAANVMPKDVADYLLWLKQFEQNRKNLEAEGVARLQAVMQTVMATYAEKMMEMANPDQDGTSAPKRDTVSADVGKVLQDWNRLTGQFNAVRPPAPCAAVASNYRSALESSVTEMSRLAQMITSVQAMSQGTGNVDQFKEKLAQLNKEKQTRSASQGIASTYATANQALDALRGQYTDMPPAVRDFKIEDSAGGGFSMPSLPGLGL